MREGAKKRGKGERGRGEIGSGEIKGKEREGKGRAERRVYLQVTSVRPKVSGAPRVRPAPEDSVPSIALFNYSILFFFLLFSSSILKNKQKETYQ